MPEEFDPAWEYYEPDPEFVDVHECPPDFMVQTGVLHVKHGRKGRGFKDCKDEFVQMWMAGVRSREIARVFGLKCTQTVKNWRAALGLPRRRQGRMAEAKQAAHVRAQVVQ